MSSIERLKRTGFQIATKLPIYKAIPVGKYRDYAAIHYMGHACPERIPTYLSAINRVPDWRYSSLLTSAHAMFAVGQDEQSRKLATRAAEMNPALPKPWLMLSDLETFSGNYPVAFRYAHNAWMLDPGSATAALKVVRLGYSVNDSQEADTTALQALECFPLDTQILWAACKYCYSEKQLTHIHELWRSQVKKPKHVAMAARPLALAALHLECFTLAMKLYAEACVIELRGLGINSLVKEKRLAGTNGLSVLQDLRDVLESENIPFFFAAGTTLGIVRNGRPLDHDDDIDVGIFQDHWDRDKLKRAFQKHRNFTFEATKPDKPKIRLIHRGGAGIDIFQFYREGDHVFHDGNFVRWKNSAFEIERHETDDGSVLYLPSNTDRYLTENYGDWRTPDSRFDAFVHGPNAEITCTEYFQVHRIRRAYKFIRAKDLLNAYDELARVKPVLAQSDAGLALIREMQL